MSVKKSNTEKQDGGRTLDVRAPYEAPRLMKKRSVARVTLFSGGLGAGGAVGVGGVTAA